MGPVGVQALSGGSNVSSVLLRVLAAGAASFLMGVGAAAILYAYTGWSL